MRRHLEQHQVVGAGQHFVVAEVHLVLAMGVFMVDLQHVQAAALQRLLQALQKAALARQALQVVAGLVEPVAIVGGQPAAAGLAQQKKFRLDAGAQVPALGCQPRHLAAQHLAWAGIERRAGHEAVADHPRIAGQPGQGGGGAGGAAAPVFAARAAAGQAGAHDRRAREPGAVGQQVVQMGQRHELAARHAMQVGELRDQRVHALRSETLAEVFHQAAPVPCRGGGTLPTL